MGYFDTRGLFVDRGELSITSSNELLSRRAVNFEVFSGFVADKKILDVGCCDGRWSAWMLDHGASYVHGIDVNPTYINQGAVTIMPNYFPVEKFSFEVADIFSYQPSAPFDAVALFGVLYFKTPMEMIAKACSIADVILVDTVVDSITVDGGQIFESDVMQKFSDLGFSVQTLSPQQPFDGRVMFVASRVTT